MYVIDQDYKILYRNNEFQEGYPQIKDGEICYRALGGFDKPCEHCPRRKEGKGNTFYNVATGEWVRAQLAELEWEGQAGCYAIFCRVWKGTKGDKERNREEEKREVVEEMLIANDQMAQDMQQIQAGLKQKNELLIQQKQDLMLALSREFGNVYGVDLDADTFETYRLDSYISMMVQSVMEASGRRYSQSILAYVESCVYEKDRQMVEEALTVENIRKQLAEREFFVCTYRTNRGKNYIYYQVKCVRLGPADKISNVIIGFRDVDEAVRKEMEQKRMLADALAQAESANHAKSNFLSNMSHDIRTPLNAILGMTAIAAMNIDDKERVMDALNKITISGKHLLGLINSILDMSKIESGKISLSEEEFELSETIEQLMALFHAQLLAKNLELKINVTQIEHEHVIGDSQRLSQILINIMGNAVKFTPEGGKISIYIREKKQLVSGRGCYEFIFEDTGIGMEKEFIDKIFEPFARASDSRIIGIEGTGLGMPISVNIARMMGGDIQVESMPGKGSKFTVTVYLKVNHVTEDDIEELAKLPVLVVDDDEVACVSACEILDSLEMQAEYVLSGEEAIERVKKAHVEEADFSLIILDWKMPGKDGIETAKEIRKLIGEDIPIIILSAYDWCEIEQEAALVGINAFIEKPLFKSRLVQVLKDVLGIRREAAIKQTKSALESYEKCNYQGKRILLVEDNDLNSEVAKELLEIIGFEVDLSTNGAEAVKLVADKPDDYYDLIFMDIQMPIMNGYEAAKAIRSMEGRDSETLPIIAMTADAFAEDVKKAESAGMNGHMSKPLDLATLEKILREWIE
jgi:signal transduction histidine kinase/DNA-binding response OmpR family regulator